MVRRSSYVSAEEAAEWEAALSEPKRPKLSRRAAMMSPADEQVVRSLREAIRTENASSNDLDDLYDYFALRVARSMVAPRTEGALTAPARPRGRHELRAAQRVAARQVPTQRGALIHGTPIGRDVGTVVELATRMYGDYDAPDLAAIVEFADRALGDSRLLQSPTVREGVSQVRAAVKQAFDLVFAVVNEIAEVTEEELAQTDAGLTKLQEARQLLIAAEYTLTSLLSEYAPTERAEHERSEEGLDVFATPEAERMRPLWRKPYGKPAEYLRNAPTMEDEQRSVREAREVADRNDKPATVGRLWLADGGYRWAIRFDSEPVTFDDGSRFEPVHTVPPEA